MLMEVEVEGLQVTAEGRRRVMMSSNNDSNSHNNKNNNNNNSNNQKVNTNNNHPDHQPTNHHLYHPIINPSIHSLRNTDCFYPPCPITSSLSSITFSNNSNWLPHFISFVKNFMTI